MIGLASLKQGLYHLVINKEGCLPTFSSSANSLTANTNNKNLWHLRLGHLSGSRLNLLHEQFPFISKHINETCDICHLSKQKKFPYSISTSRATKMFDLIHMDIWGPFSKPSIYGHKYFLTILDDFSRYTWIVLLKSKAEVQSHVQNFIALIENQFHTTIKILRSDNGPEFSLKNFFASKGIIHQTSCVDTP
uniref:Retrovirus-related Pol polyprotein from transposon TNT 1-94 n=1 Tax=Cajanus cajan TaxID=3821 RepID=A0A151SA64_CAJCA|nr:Retrovirus-related Pol polyprotein from transposon TNT 1-94 [Cajanus cajan]